MSGIQTRYSLMVMVRRIFPVRSRSDNVNGHVVGGAHGLQVGGVGGRVTTDFHRADLLCYEAEVIGAAHAGGCAEDMTNDEGSKDRLFALRPRRRHRLRQLLAGLTLLLAQGRRREASGRAA